jgi:hypothetical protein
MKIIEWEPNGSDAKRALFNQINKQQEKKPRNTRDSVNCPEMTVWHYII